jgi:hypothetical protein
MEVGKILILRKRFNLKSSTRKSVKPGLEPKTATHAQVGVRSKNGVNVP